MAMVAASVVAFSATGHLAAIKVIQDQQSRQLKELADVALRRTEVAVDFGAATLDEVARLGAHACDAPSLQAVRLQVYQRSAVKDIRLVNRDGSIICSAFSETLEFDKEWVGRPDMLASVDKQLLLFRVDQISGVAFGVLKDIDKANSVVAILGINSYPFDIMPAELRDHSEVLAELGDGMDIGRFSLKREAGFSQLVSFSSASHRYPLRATVRVEASALARWNEEAYWPMMLVAFGLGLVFGLLLTKTVRRLEGPIADIDRGLARQEFRPFFQPTFDLRTGAIVGCEVLARWLRENGAVVPPMSFIPLAESSGRIEPMTWQILAAALKDLRPRLRADKHFKMSINIAPRHLLREGFVETFRRAVRSADVSARQIVIEVTEREPLPDLERAASVVRELHEYGFRVAMDDVGVGHSGLSQIKKLNVDTMKIDKFFVDTIAQDGSAVTIVEMLVRLAAKLNMSVIAEGIESPEQVEGLMACGVEYGQGYIVSPPLPFPEFDELVDARTTRTALEATLREPSLVA